MSLLQLNLALDAGDLVCEPHTFKIVSTDSLLTPSREYCTTSDVATWLDSNIPSIPSHLCPQQTLEGLSSSLPPERTWRVHTPPPVEKHELQDFFRSLNEPIEVDDAKLDPPSKEFKRYVRLVHDALKSTDEVNPSNISTP